jgi:hypothetical protein
VTESAINGSLYDHLPSNPSASPLSLLRGETRIATVTSEISQEAPAHYEMSEKNCDSRVARKRSKSAPSDGNEAMVLFKRVRKECVISGNTVIIDFVYKDCALNSSAAASQ